MKIVYLTQYAVDGQLQSQFFNYSQDISAGYEVEVLYLFSYSDNNTLIASYKEAGVKVSSLNFKGGRISPANMARYIKRIKEINPDIVHSQHPIAGFYNKVGTNLINLSRKKKIGIITEQRCVKSNLSFFAKVLETSTMPLSDLIFCSSDSVELSYFNKVNSYQDYLQGKKVKHFTFYNSISTSSFSLLGKPHLTGLSKKDQIKICIVGRNEPVKQPQLVIEAIGLLKHSNTKLYLAGMGSLDEQLKAYVNDHNLQNRVEFLGNIDWVVQLLNDSDIYVNYSKHEGLCKSLLEAMAAGTPVIASRVEGNREVVGENDQYGLLVQDKSPADLATAIDTLINDDDLYLQYAKAGLERIKSFDAKHQIREVEKIYKKLMNEA